MHLDPILRVIFKLLVPFVLIFALYVQFHGEYGPGGGFQAGVAIGACVILYAIMFGLENAMRMVPMRLVEVLIPAGVLIYGGVGVVTLLLGAEYLNYDVLVPGSRQTAQVLGVILVEIGVLVTVAATMVAIFYAFAGRGR